MFNSRCIDRQADFVASVISPVSVLLGRYRTGNKLSPVSLLPAIADKLIVDVMELMKIWNKALSLIIYRQ